MANGYAAHTICHQIHPSEVVKECVAKCVKFCSDVPPFLGSTLNDFRSTSSMMPLDVAMRNHTKTSLALNFHRILEPC